MGTRTRTDFQVESQKVKWDPKTVEIKTRSVEKTLEPLVHQVRRPHWAVLTLVSIHANA